MIRGCFTNIFAGIGCLTVLLIGAAGVWYFRADISEFYQTFVERDADIDAVQMTTGRPSPAALESAMEKERAIALARQERESLKAVVASLKQEKTSLEASIKIPGRR